MDPAVSSALREVYVVACIVGVFSGFIGNILGSRITVRWLEKSRTEIWDAIRDLRTGKETQGEQIAEMKGRCDTVMKFDLHAKKKSVYQSGSVGP